MTENNLSISPAHTAGVSRWTLPNGLRCVHCPDTATAMVAVNVLYGTGARHEDPNLTGIAHLFEHVMFGGSKNVPEYDETLSAAGGENNAFTGADFTNYYAVAPAHNAETLFYLESDRMLQPLLSDSTVNVQRQVVVEEFKQQCLNAPYGDTQHHLRAMLYPEGHPYSWPVIGKKPEHIEAATQADMQRWFDDNYSPANAVLAITGNITAERARELSEKWFGTLPARPPRQYSVETVEPLEKFIYREVTGPVPATTVTLAWLTDCYGTHGFRSADALTDILALGKASRFYTNLVTARPDLFTEADAAVSGAEHQGTILLTARLAQDADPHEAIRVMYEQLREVAENGPTEQEVTRIKNKQRASYAMGAMDYTELGHRLALEVMHGEEPDQAINSYLKLTAADIQAEARRLVTDSQPAVLVYKPQIDNPTQ